MLLKIIKRETKTLHKNCQQLVERDKCKHMKQDNSNILFTKIKKNVKNDKKIDLFEKCLINPISHRIACDMNILVKEAYDKNIYF